MNELTTRPLATADLTAASRQLSASYQAAYRGLMTDAYLDSLAETHWVAILEESLGRGDTGILLTLGQKIIGTAVFGSSEDGPASCATLHAIYLLPQAVGRGMGRLLYAEAEKAMAAQGFQRCILEVLSQNHRAIRFYLAHGYAKTKTHWVEENGMTLSCDWMEKQLL